MSDIFNPHTDIGEFKKEQVALDSGKMLWVWELSTADQLRIVERSALPAGMPDGTRISRSDSLVWRIIQSCFNGDGPQAQRIFKEEDVLLLYRMKSRDTGKILDAIDRVNGTDPESITALTDFSPVPAGEPTGT